MLLQYFRFIASLALVIVLSWVGAQNAAAQSASPRAALVIGNGAYTDAPCESAVEGARSVAEALRLGGFKVVYLENARKDDMQRGLAAFSQILERGGTGVIYYGGHAVQHQGRNYLVALDSKITGPDDVSREAVDLDLFLDPPLVARTPGSVIILDASRANPYQQRLPGNLRGLANPESLKTISVISSIAPGKTVGSGQAESVFATQLVQAMRSPGIGFDAVVSRTRSAVTRINGKEQTVWQSANPPADLIITPTGAPAAGKPADAVELGFWDTIKNSNTAADFQAYLSAYPEGQFAMIARAKLAQLQPNVQPQPTQQAAQPQPVQPQANAQPQPTKAPEAPRPTPSAGQVATPATPTAPARPAEAAPAPAPAAAAASTPIRDCPICPELVLIPNGTFSMGSPEVFAFETPVHDVTIAKPFYMGRREVTFDEWDACLSEGGCQYRPGDRGHGRGLNPASDLDWNDARTYLGWLSRKTGKTYRLATEAEWEYAARGGTKTTYYWGNALEKDRANCAGCNTNPINKTIATGTFPANAFGLFDMAGNAAEWVEDCWADNYKSASKDGAAYSKPDCRERVLRGGSFNNDPRFVRTAARFKYDFDVRYYTNGFRVVRDR